MKIAIGVTGNELGCAGAVSGGHASAAGTQYFAQGLTIGYG
jgi:hypothetical protein